VSFFDDQLAYSQSKALTSQEKENPKKENKTKPKE
jgi:hypothetical protein